VPASAKVPPAVASEEIATQSATARDYLGGIDEMEIDPPRDSSRGSLISPHG
jgi:hypothetical protein